jgi:hypothetical protein
MKTTYTILAILASVLFTQSATAKLGVNRIKLQFENTIGINIESEIENNINLMLANVQSHSTQAELVKQFDIETLESQANELVQNVGKKLPEFKFKVIIAE